MTFLTLSSFSFFLYPFLFTGHSHHHYHHTHPPLSPSSPHRTHHLSLLSCQISPPLSSPPSSSLSSPSLSQHSTNNNTVVVVTIRSPPPVAVIITPDADLTSFTSWPADPVVDLKYRCRVLTSIDLRSHRHGFAVVFTLPNMVMALPEPN